MFPKYLFDSGESANSQKQFITWWTKYYAYPGSNVKDYHDYWESLGFPEYMDEAYNDLLLEAYEWEKMHPKERWEQKQLNKFEKLAALQQLPLIQHEIKQQRQIDEVVKMLEEEQAQQNREQLIRRQLSENAAFIVQQLPEN
ncbi:unnamed protein product [Rotaria sordida]|uniref:Uncharacterized protein n=1 Tax=Rotaria sordida TaxID=392033 RepID=A0A815GRJ9_9BILA|nr:unnamed protein product [Rotaria sordida]CAF1342094.1 unnamed protein product [Rotaria sordida]CAF3749404.1 unnamed protein product [Rotaria sordida]CAF3771061.1 unnamed protein product [Rotaria sordida]